MAIPKGSETIAPKLLFFLPDLDGGGAQRTVVNLVNRLSKDSFRASLAAVRTDGPAKDWLDDDVELIDLDAGRIRRAVLPLRQTVARMAPDILFSTILDANIVAALATCGLPQRPALIVRETNSIRAREDIGWWRRKLVSWAYPRADAVVALSRGVERELATDYRLPASRLRTIWNPVDLSAVRRRASEGDAECAPFEGITLMAVGRLHRQKGFDILIRALACLERQDLRLVILGTGSEETELHRLAADLNVGNQIHFAGFIDNPYPWIANADIFVLPSRWEGFGHVLVEAMALGTAVVASDCPYGPADIVTDGVDGCLVGNESPELLAEAIASLADYPDKRKQFAAAASAKVERFDVSRIVNEYAALFDIVSDPAKRVKS